METALQARMNKDFDKELGEFQCNVIERENNDKFVLVPLSSEKTILAVMEKEKEHRSFVNNTTRMSFA